MDDALTLKQYSIIHNEKTIEGLKTFSREEVLKQLEERAHARVTSWRNAVTIPTYYDRYKAVNYARQWAL